MKHYTIYDAVEFFALAKKHEERFFPGPSHSELSTALFLSVEEAERLRKELEIVKAERDASS